MVAGLAQDGWTIAVAGVAMRQELMDWLRKPYGLVTSCALCTGIVVGTIDDLRHWAIAKASAVFQTAVTAQQACIDQYLDSRPETTEGPYLIIMTDLVNDEDQTQTRLVDQNLRDLYGQDRNGPIQLEAAPCTIYATSGNASDRYEGAKQTALEIANRTKADVVIWGEVKDSDSKIALSMTYATDTSASDYKVEQKTLDTDFGADIGSLIAVKMLTLVNISVEESGGFLSDRMRKVSQLAAPLLADFPAQMTASDQADLFLADGLAKYFIGSESGDAAQLQSAGDAFQNAISRYDRIAEAKDWSIAQTNLGVVLQALGNRDPYNLLLEQSVEAYIAALGAQSREDDPLRWALLQNNLGNALQTLGERDEGTERLEQAVAAYTLALEERKRDKVPLFWASTQLNLGSALSYLGEREDGTEHLEQAIVALRACLEEYRRDLVPLDWARAQNNLGTALQRLGERQDGTALLDEAAQAYSAALTERAKDRLPIDWAMTTANLGKLDLAYFDRTGDVARLDSAQDLMTAARAVFQDSGAVNFVEVIDRNLDRVRDRRP